MALKIAINGFGRIGRCVTRVISKRDDVELVAINDVASLDMMLYLLQNDSVHGGFESEVSELEDGNLSIDGKKVLISSQTDPKKLDFAKCGADVVIECSGKFLTKDLVQHHIDKGVKKVIFSAPAKDDTPTFVLGVNEEKYSGEDIISNASCTTNCLGPIAKILDDEFGIEKGLMTTIHSYTNDQSILDVTHKRDKRRARAAGVNIIPTSTGAAKALKLVLPNLEGKLHGQSVRVPTPDVSMVDLNVVLKRNTTTKEVSELFDDFANTKLKNIILIDKKMKVSQDIVGSAFSAVIAEDLTQVIGGNMLKVMAWYDNEWGYSNRLIDMALYITKKD
jgi:glyceraldehyde 3-phosphate dehydrogenase